MRRSATLAFLALAALPMPAVAQAPAPVAPPGVAAHPAPVAPAIPVTPTPASPALPPPAIASAPPAQASPSAIPAAVPVQPPPSQAAAGAGVAAAVGGAVSALIDGPPPAKRTPRDNEVEMTRPEYRARLVACLEFRAGCNVRGLTRSDQDYLRYELKGQRYAGVMLDEIADARMSQFGGDLTVIAPNAKGANPEWHSLLKAAPQVDPSGRPRSGYGMSRTEPQRVGGEMVRTRHVPWPRQEPARSASANDFD